METRRKVKFINSLSTKLAILMLICVTYAVTTTAVVCLSKAKKLHGTSMMNYAQTVAEDSARSLDGAETGGIVLDAEITGNLISGANLIGTETSYCYVCEPDGTILYHPTESKIGKMVENEAVRELVAQLAEGKKPAAGSFEYDYNGAKKFAGYAFTLTNKIVIMTADYSEAMAAVNKITRSTVASNTIIVLWMTIVGFIAVKLFLRAVSKIVQIVEETAAFDLRSKPGNEKLKKRRDELGIIANAIGDMRTQLRDIVNQIEDSTGALDVNIQNLTESSDNVNAMCSDNSATTEELAAGMQETSATTETINENINHMLSNANTIDELAVEGGELSDDISKRAKALKQSMVESTQKTEGIYASVKERADKAIENSKVVAKINEMTNQIMEISSQTSLLALNASIEAARAGENGRGFAVVATEIGNLATQSTNAVSSIDSMVNEVTAAVAQMQECLAETTTFIGENVITDYKQFEKVSEQYDGDAEKFRDSMNSIRDGISELNTTIGTVADSVSGINTTICEAAHGVSGIAETTSEIVIMADGTASKANECREEIVGLNDIVSRFTVE